MRLARRLGATGLESDVWITADGEAVLDHDGLVRSGVRRRAVRDVARRDLPAHVPSLSELYEACGTDFDLSLDVKDPAAIDAVLAAARDAGGDAEGRLWLCHHDWHVVAGWRDLTAGARLVDSTRLRAMRQGPERRAAELADAGIDCVNMHHSDWSGGLVALFHRFDLRAFAWDAQFERIITALVGYGHRRHLQRPRRPPHRRPQDLAPPLCRSGRIAAIPARRTCATAARRS